MHRKGDLGQPGISQEKFSGGDKERGGIYQKKKRGAGLRDGIAGIRTCIGKGQCVQV